MALLLRMAFERLDTAAGVGDLMRDLFARALRAEDGGVSPLAEIADRLGVRRCRKISYPIRSMLKSWGSARWKIRPSVRTEQKWPRKAATHPSVPMRDLSAVAAERRGQRTSGD